MNNLIKVFLVLREISLPTVWSMVVKMDMLGQIRYEECMNMILRQLYDELKSGRPSGLDT